jgi:Co/Zn/Cd efflux system component
MFAHMSVRRAVIIVAILNGLYFVVEFTMASRTGSVSLFADSIDFLEDASLNVLVILGIGWTAARRAILGRFLAALLLIPAVTALWVLVSKLMNPDPPAPVEWGVTSVGALVVNLFCAYLLVSRRNAEGSLSKAAWLSARNDAVINVAMIAGALLTLVWLSIWPDVVLGAIIIVLNADAAFKVWRTAGAERPPESSEP